MPRRRSYRARKRSGPPQLGEIGHATARAVLDLAMEAAGGVGGFPRLSNSEFLVLACQESNRD